MSSEKPKLTKSDMDRKLVEYYKELVDLEDSRWEHVHDKANSYISVQGFYLTAISFAFFFSNDKVGELAWLYILGVMLIIGSVLIHLKMTFPSNKNRLPWEDEQVATLIDDEQLFREYQYIAKENRKRNDSRNRWLKVMVALTISFMTVFTLLLVLSLIPIG